jgi:beta-glucosidase
VASEDSFLSGKVGAAMTRGIQGDPSDKYVLILGALKHVTAYSLENWVDTTGGPRNGTKYNRMGFSAVISRHDLAETYLEQYRIAISESNALGMMCSYTAINGTASCENGHLLNTWARGAVGFNGNVVTDCGGLKMSSEPKDAVVSSADALNAGTGLTPVLLL